MRISSILKVARTTLTQHSPTILTGFAVVGVVATAALAAKGVAPAYSKYHETNIYRDKDGKEPLTRIGAIRVVWRPFLPALLMGGATIGCIIGAHSVNIHRQAALAAGYSLATKAVHEYEAAHKSELGEQSLEKVREKVVQTRLDNDPIVLNDVILTGKGDHLCYDTLSGRYFKSDIESLRRVQNDLNYQLLGGSWASVNDLYRLLDLEEIKLGDDLGWLPDDPMEFRFMSKIASDNTPCLVLDYVVDPKADFYRSI